MNMNKKTIVFAIALFPSFVCGMGLPTVSDLCNAGAELFGCRQTRPGAEVFPCFSCLPKRNLPVLVATSHNANEDMKEFNKTVNNDRNTKYTKLTDAQKYEILEKYTNKQMQILLRKYNIAKESECYVSEETELAARSYAWNLEKANGILKSK